MREHGYHPAGGPRQVQAVAADPDLAQKLNTNNREPLLLLQGVTRDALGHGLEWFNVWHSPNTVFDVDAQVTSQPAPVSEEHIRRLRTLTQQLESELAALDNSSR
jgi:GntR family transcriptional regulator